MKKELPTWALAAATVQDRQWAEQANRQGVMQVKWPERKAIRAWAKRQGWPNPWFAFEDAFIKMALATDENFALALRESGLEIVIPLPRYVLPAEDLRELDALYAERNADGRPTSWGSLVERLRGIRRAVEAGTAVEIEGKTLKSWGSFYNWAHGRYHALEDGYDSWIGDDNS
jgi:hypothetical protein